MYSVYNKQAHRRHNAHGGRVTGQYVYSAYLKPSEYKYKGVYHKDMDSMDLLPQDYSQLRKMVANPMEKEGKD